jgi:proteasome lid subunit RPN8/RPN11
LAKWRLTSWNDTPGWWSQELEAQVESAANSALPNETVGLFYLDLNSADLSPVHVHVFNGFATERFIDADPRDVITFCYEFLTARTEVLGTFHTHPQGSQNFSERDQMLGLWGKTHLLLAFDDGLWTSHWAVRARL